MAGDCRNCAAGMLPPTPLGLDALYSLCRSVYPDQDNPLQVTALLKYWLGGPDPLDYISMYGNPGAPERGVPSHWHYVSYGLSDLHGDGRVHDVSGPDGPSGFGFELTFRLRREPGESAPPTWPAAVMQALAKYVFRSGNVLRAGDHVSWHCALDGSESRIQHMLMAEDPQLGAAGTPFGTVHFVQIVGVCTEELRAAQHWNGSGVLEILRRLPDAGGPWLITDLRRGESMLEADPAAREEVVRGIETEGSNLSGVSGRCSWTRLDGEPGFTRPSDDGGLLREGPPTRPDASDLPQISQQDSQQIKTALRKGLLNTKPVLPPIGKLQDVNENEDDRVKKETPDESVCSNPEALDSTELSVTKNFEGLHLTFNLESGSLLPLAIKGRVKHGRHFTFQSVLGDTAITLVASGVTGALVSPEHPYVARGSWLQVLVPDDLAEQMAGSFERLGGFEDLGAQASPLDLPTVFFWPDHNLRVTILEDKL
ncbi:suppressor of fused homolog [Bacillus rossius redtenbacheri]|uniref:suppressor of fused homolog n=1 Tax=Bacillus rossius redtenbacheri TaxID=93214 RepID=UPI002FDEE44C